MNQPDTSPGPMQSVASAADLPGVRGIFSRLTSRSTAARGAANANRTATRLSGRWLLLARMGWLSVAVVSITSFLLTIPFTFTQLEQVCTGAVCDFHLRQEDLPVLAEWGLSPAAFAAYGTALNGLALLSWIAMGLLLFWRQSAEPRALFFSFCLLVFGGGPNPNLATVQPIWRLPVSAYGFLASTCLNLLLLLFPNGQFVPRWTRWVALVSVVVNVPLYFFPNLPLSPDTWPGAAFILGFFGGVIAAQVYRYVRRSTPLERQQTKWVLLALGLFLLLLLGAGPVVTGKARALWVLLVFGPAFQVAILLVPVAIAASILRYRLWEVDHLINRTLVYGLLTASVVGLYVLIVGALGALFRSSDSPLLAILTTGLIALLFHPLRQRLQRAVNRLLYGQRDDPTAVLARLLSRLEATLAPEAVLPTLVQTMHEALRLPYAAIALRQEEMFEVAASAGKPVEDPLCLPLVYQGEPVGQLRVGARTPGEAFSAADRHVLQTIAYQAGAAVHTVRLTTALQRSRQHLVTAREEERRRLRRDLHDGLGPVLATLAMQAEEAREQLPAASEQSATSLTDLITQAHGALEDIRRLVYALRPPALDALGLVGAIKEQATQYARQNLSIIVDAPEHLPPLPAAVEVAAYRIVLEALTNVVRHAGAHTCTVSVRLNDTLDLEVTDDGRGLPAICHAGVGLPSMRERAAELGGACEITSIPGQGTCLRVRLPRHIE